RGARTGRDQGFFRPLRRGPQDARRLGVGDRPAALLDFPRRRADRRMTERTYREYVTDDEFITGYSEYQRRYAANIRESDRVLVGLVRDVTEGEKGTLLDIGCSTGNLLRHLKRLVPGLELVGGDLTPRVLEECRRDPELADVSFEELDI